MGISVKTKDEGEGAYVIRIASDSPLDKNLRLGDTILRINEDKVIMTEDIPRLIGLSNYNVKFTV